MRKFVPLRYKRLYRVMIRRLVQVGHYLETRYALPGAPPTLPTAIQQALALALPDLVAPVESDQLSGQLCREHDRHSAPTSRDIFFLDGVALPCWQESDLTPHDDWLTSANYYPIYYTLFQQLTTPGRKTRMLEIGVRTGYMGAVFARAARGAAYYLGIDPNLYMHQGLRLAGETLKILRRQCHDFDFTLIEGYSWDQAVQSSLEYSGPFDILHIDGDHTLLGKLLDLDLARRLIAPDGVILVDDYEHHSIVEDAIRRAWQLGWFKEFAFIPTKRGLAVLRCSTTSDMHRA